MLIIPWPKFISSILAEVMISFAWNSETTEIICLIIRISLNVFLTSLKISCFSQWLESRASIQVGYLILTHCTGNSYRSFSKIKLIFSKLKLEQSMGKTETLYFSSRVVAKFWQNSELGSDEFNTMTNGLFRALSSLATLSSART